MELKKAARGSALWLTKVLLVASIILTISIYSGSYATSEGFVKPLVREVVFSQFNESMISEASESFMLLCDSKSNEILNFSVEGLGDVSINCSNLRANEQLEIKNIVEKQIVEKTFNSFYEQSVCNGSECIKFLKELPANIKENPLNALKIVSRDFNTFLKSKLFVLLIVSLILMIFLFILAEGISKKFTTLGSVLISAGLPYAGMPLLKSTLKTNIPENIYELTIGLTNMLSNIFLSMLIGGIVLFGIGIGLKIYYKKKEKTEGKKEGKKKKIIN